MLGVTFFGIFLTPVFFFVVDCARARARCSAPGGPRSRRPGCTPSSWLSVRAARDAGRRRTLARRPPRTAKPQAGPRPRSSTPMHELASASPSSLRRRGTDVLTLLHRPADLRLGAVDRHHAGRRRSRCSRCRSRSTRRSRRRRSRSRPYYPGANAQVVADTVAAPIEQQVNGVEDMMYMSSQCTNDGTYTLTVTFKPGVDLNMAQVLVQNRGRPGRADPARPGQAPRRDGQEEVAQHADDRQPVLARRQRATTCT